MDPILLAPTYELLALLSVTGGLVCGALELRRLTRSGRRFPSPTDVMGRLGRNNSPNDL